MTRIDEIRAYINKMTIRDLLAVVEDINSYDGYFEDLEWLDMEEFDEVLRGVRPMEIARMIHYGDFKIHDDYFRFDVYGTLETCSVAERNLQLDESSGEIAEYLLDFSGSVSDEKLQVLLDADDTTFFDVNF